MSYYKLDQNAGDIIEKALLAYRCVNQQDDEDANGYPLIDALTPPWAETIQEGRAEIKALTDHIFTEVELAIREGKVSL